MKEIALTQGKFALVDDEDFDFLNQWKWCAVKARHTFYAVRSMPGINRKQINVFMHRQILNITDSKIQGDHLDGDGLNNQRKNLRACTKDENNRNKRIDRRSTTGYKGVVKIKKNGYYRASIMNNKKRKHLGIFKTPESAALAYDEAAKKYYGEFARLNLPK
jgi:hypothetical protein